MGRRGEAVNGTRMKYECRELSWMKKKGEGWEGERGCHARLIVSKHEALEVIRQAMPDLGRERD
jgi:hypothetical protein